MPFRGVYPQQDMGGGATTDLLEVAVAETDEV